MKKLIITQFIILLSGTVFAWGNFGWELYNWLKQGSCDLGCSITAPVNPFLTPCFFGALFFTAAFILSLVILVKNKNEAKAV